MTAVAAVIGDVIPTRAEQGTGLTELQFFIRTTFLRVPPPAPHHILELLCVGAVFCLDAGLIHLHISRSVYHFS